MKKIIFVTDTMTTGGAERVISVLANNLCEKNFDVEIVCLRQRKVHYSLNDRIKISFAEDHSSNWISRIFWLREYLNGKSIIIAFMVKVYCIVLLSQLFTKTKIICSERNDPHSTKFPWNYLRKKLLFRANVFVVQTAKMKEFYSQKIQDKSVIIYNPLSLEQCSNLLWDSSRRSILAMGRIDKQKNYPMMLSAFLKFHKKYPDFILNIWGNRGHDEQEELIKKIIRDNNAEKYIKINGRCNDVSKEYGKAYMFLMTSKWEGFSNSLIEAFCSGVPVISTKVSGATDLIISGKNGYLINIEDVNALYESMVSLVSNVSNAEKFSKEGIGSRKLFDVEFICDKWIDVINNV